jgi:hypothetical protein
MANFNVNLNLSTIILIGVIAFLLFGGSIKLYQNKVDNLKDKLETEIKLKDALMDSIRYHKNKYNELVAEKLTIQETIKNLEKINGQLTASQKELMRRVIELNDKNAVIAAALVQNQIIIDSLIHQGQTTIDTTKKTINFNDNYKEGKKEFSYSFTIGKVLPAYMNEKPTLRIDSLYFPNKQFISFQWKKVKGKNYPISFSVSNSNDFFKTVNLDSYAIPALKKDEIDPNKWQKIGNFFRKNGQTLMYIGIGGAVGVGTYIIMTK